MYRNLLFLLFLVLITACSTNSSIPASIADDFDEAGISDDAEENLKSSQLTEFNERIAFLGSSSQSGDDINEYLLGPGDVIEITVFQVDELNTKARVNGNGDIILPLLGMIKVAEKSVAQVEREIVDALAKDYLQNPQVGIFIDEYRSQQITVMGAVVEPNVYNVRQSRSIFEMLSMAGGITEKASDKMRVRLNRKDEIGQQKQINLVLSMQELLKGSDQAHMLRLQGGDSILVPEAGVIFVEGAVKKPGSYKMDGDVNVLKALALAGGIPWEAKNNIQVIREVDGRPVAVTVDIEAIKDQEEEDIILEDGDVVVVDYNLGKRAFTGFFKTFGSIFGYSLN